MRARPITIVAALAACSGASHPAGHATGTPVIDRFSASAGHLMVRDAKHPLPAADQPIDFDQPPFITQGLGPDGSAVRYYNFDVQSAVPATLYRMTRPGGHVALDGVPDVIDVLPGEAGYSDFWRIAWVDVPADDKTAAPRSLAEIVARGFAIASDPVVIDCPVVPRGSTARTADGVKPAALHELLYRSHALQCLAFGEPLVLDGDKVPTSPIYVTFGKEPDAGFEHEGASAQTHNVVMSVPGDTDYSPLWDVHIYDPAAFPKVHNADTALAAPLAKHGPLVNCPIVSVGHPLGSTAAR